MKPKSDAELQKVLDRYLHLIQQMSEAQRRRDVTAYNRDATKLVAVEDQIEQAGEAGRRALETLVNSESPHVQLFSAHRVLKWDPAKAVPVLGRLMTGDALAGLSIHERLSVSLSACTMLRIHLKVRPYDGTELIEPMRAYGFEIPESFFLTDLR
jgi:hypothetical protein